jgi:hypothetical protein
VIVLAGCVEAAPRISVPVRAHAPAAVDPVVAWADDAAPWEPRDALASDPAVSILDPEYDAVTGWVVHASQDGELWVAQRDPVTGALVPPDLRGTLVDTDVAPYGAALNGPEFVQSARGGEIAYARAAGDSFELVHAWFDGVGWSTSPVDGVLGRVGVIGSQEPWDDDARLVHLDAFSGAAGWTHLEGGEGGTIGVDLLHAPRFTLGDRSLVWSDLVDGVLQVHLYEQDEDTTTVLTDGPAGSQVPWMWIAPEYDERLFFARREDGLVGTVLDILRRVDGRWQVIKSIVPPAATPFVVSPEPWVVAGRSLVAFQAVNEAHTRSEIWVASSTPEGDELRRVDAGLPGRAIDPEWAMVGAEARVYYLHLGQDTRTVRVCATDLP